MAAKTDVLNHLLLLFLISQQTRRALEMKSLLAWVVVLLLQGVLLTGAQDCPDGGCPCLSVCLCLCICKSHLVAFCSTVCVCYVWSLIHLQAVVHHLLSWLPHQLTTSGLCLDWGTLLQSLLSSGAATFPATLAHACS